MKRLMVFLFFIVFLIPAPAAGEKEICLSFGGGYSYITDDLLRNTWFISRGLINFQEEIKIKNRMNLNLQYFLNKAWGFQLEIDQQKGRYSSNLKWYGVFNSISDPPIIDVNYFEDPYQKNWSFSSATFSILFAYRKSIQQKIIPYLFVGVGAYLLEGDQKKVLDRWRLGPNKSGTKLRIGGGIKLRLTSRARINIRIIAESILRKYGSESTFYAGPEQFSLDAYFNDDKIMRSGEALTQSFFYIALDINFEFLLRRFSKDTVFE